MKYFITVVLILMLSTFMAVPAFADGVRDANAAYNELLSTFNGKYPDEYAGAYLDTSDSKLCVLLTERHADTTSKFGAAQDKMLSYISTSYRSSITFSTAKYSYNELLASRDTASTLLRDKGYSLSSAGIKDDNNIAEIGVTPEDYTAVVDFVKTHSSLKTLPLSIVSADRMSPADNESPSAMPQTGSNGNRTLWLALLLISCGALLGMTVFARKRKRT